MDIDNMPADAELDALVAERVMHLDDVHMGVMAYWFTPVGSGYNAEPRRTEGIHHMSKDAYVYKAREPYSGQQLQCHDSGYEAVPDYSTDWAAAAEVLENFAPHGSLSFSLNRFHSSAGTDRDWQAAFGHIVADAPTAPLAICRAALKAAEKGGG